MEYTFPNTSQKLLSNFVEAVRALRRVEDRALIEMEMAGEKVRSLEDRYRLETERIEGYRSAGVDLPIVSAGSAAWEFADTYRAVVQALAPSG